MPLVYVLVKGSPLTKAEFDGNISNLDGRLVALEDDLPTPVGIDDVEQIGESFQFVFTDSTVSSLIQLPEVSIRGMGAWLPLTSYLRNDIVSANGNAYIVRVNHTSEATFDAGAINSDDGELYALMIPAPELSLPPSGGEGMVLTKASDSDYDMQWTNAGVPIGGIAGSVLTKASGDDYDTEWAAAASAPVAEIAVTEFSPALADANGFFVCTHTSGCLVRIPEHTSVAFPIGTELHFCQDTSVGSVILIGQDSDNNVLVEAPVGYEPLTALHGAVITAKKIDANRWKVFGLVAAEQASDTA